MVENSKTPVFKWNIKTEKGVFTGTCLSMDDVYEKILMLTNKSRILEGNLIPIRVASHTTQTNFNL